MAQARRSWRHRGFAQESRATLSFRGRYPRPVQTRSQVDGNAEAAGIGPGLVPGARHFRGRRHLVSLVLRRRASWTRSRLGAPLAPPQPPCARRSHPAHPTRRPRTFPPSCTALALLIAYLTTTLHPFALVCAGAQSRPSASARVECGVPRRRGGGGTARVGRERACARLGGA